MSGSSHDQGPNDCGPSPADMLMLAQGQAHAMAVQDAVGFLRSAYALSVATVARGAAAGGEEAHQAIHTAERLLQLATQQYRHVSEAGLQGIWRLQHGGRPLGRDGHSGSDGRSQGSHGGQHPRGGDGQGSSQDPLSAVAARRSELDPSVFGVAGPDDQDNLQRIHNIGPEVEQKLHALGIMSYAQVARLTPEILAQITDILGLLPGSAEEQGWVAQAEALLARKLADEAGAAEE